MKQDFFRNGLGARKDQGCSQAKVVVAVSGRGQSLENFINKERDFKNYKVCGVIASKRDCRAVDIAQKNEIPLYFNSFAGMAEAPSDLVDWLHDIGANWIALAGFVHKFPTIFPAGSAWKYHIINIHPALLPHFGGKNMYGMRVHKTVLDSAQTHSGATVHYVDENYDTGSIISQIKVKVCSGESPASLAARVFRAECELYPRTLSDLIKGSVPLPGGSVKWYDFSTQQEGREFAR